MAPKLNDASDITLDDAQSVNSSASSFTSEYSNWSDASASSPAIVKVARSTRSKASSRGTHARGRQWRWSKPRLIALVWVCHVLFQGWVWWELLVKGTIPTNPVFLRSYSPWCFGLFATASSSVVLLAWTIFELHRTDSRQGMRWASVMFFSGVAQLNARQGTSLLEAREDMCPGYLSFMTMVAVIPVITAMEVCGREVARTRLVILEEAMEENFGSRILWWVNLVAIIPVLSMTFVLLVLLVPVTVSPSCISFMSHISVHDDSPMMGTVLLSSSLPCAGWAIALFMINRAFLRVIRVASVRLPDSTSAYVRAEAQWACAVLAKARWCSLVSPCFGTLACLNDVLTTMLKTNFLMSVECFSLVVATVLCVDCLALSLFVGLFRPSRPQVVLERSASGGAQQPVLRQTSAVSIPDWEDKVDELAYRYMTAEGLLDFFSLLGTDHVMPHFDPHRHTTNDVVRHAIVPLSQQGEGGSAYASLVAKKLPDQPLLPERMVTHDWRNLFIYLLAAMLADALGLQEYADVADLLAAGQFNVLRVRLAKAGTHGRRYWCCCFCINQHSTICDGYGPQPADAAEFARWDRNRRDSATGLLLPCCNCKEPKLLNETQGDLCEANKFDSMMEALSLRSPGFRQIVAVDPQFGILSRIWAIAELVQADVSGIPQDVQLLSCDVLDIDNPDLGVYAGLANLRVQDCHASREDDKSYILGKIADLQDFDARLHYMIFGDHGLLHGPLRGLDFMHAAVRTGLRVHAAACYTQCDSC